MNFTKGATIVIVAFFGLLAVREICLAFVQVFS